MMYKVGDVVMIRKWDDMEREFGLDCAGAIKCREDFMPEMRVFCGRAAKITHVEVNGVLSYTIYKLEFDGDESTWNFTEDMLVKTINGGRIANIKKVIFNNPATIIFWVDGTKTVVKAQDDKYDKMVGFAMCICKKMLGNKGNYYNVFRKWLGE